jgi:hypothetical protein
MGYVEVRSLGYIQADAPLSGALGSKGVGVAWASRFGLAARVGLSKTALGPDGNFI